MTEFRARPGLYSHFREPLQSELVKIWRYLPIITPYRLYSHTDGKLYIQVYSPNDKKHLSIARLDKDGNLEVTGTVTGSVTLPNVGGD